MQTLSLEKQFSVFANEVIHKRVLVGLLFTLVTFSILFAGLKWPKIYESNASILWTKSDPISSLLQDGYGNRTDVREQVEIAKRVILSNLILDQLIEKTGLDENEQGGKLNERELEIQKGKLRSNIEVFNTSASVIQVSYRNVDPQLSYLVVSIVTNLFLEETQRVTNKTSQSAFDFVNKQVIDYKNKLDDINNQIIEFRKMNADLDSDTRSGVNSRVNELKQSIRENTLKLKELQIKKEALQEQLTKERLKIEKQLAKKSEQANSLKQRSANVDRLKKLQQDLDTLRLSYTESYPDIIQLKEQIKNLKAQIKQDKSNPSAGSETETRLFSQPNAEVAFVESPLFTRLSGEIADTETEIKTLTARNGDTKIRLDNELLRATKVSTQESKLDELTRDLRVTQNLYDDLLKKRENARVSLNLQKENQGSTFKLQEAATLPLVPVGLRFLHFFVGSVPIGLMVPLGIIYVLLLLDNRIRHEDSLDEEQLGIPVIGTIQHYPNEDEIKNEKFKTTISITLFSGMFVVLVVVAILKLNNLIGT